MRTREIRYGTLVARRHGARRRALEGNHDDRAHRMRPRGAPERAREARGPQERSRVAVRASLDRLARERRRRGPGLRKALRLAGAPDMNDPLGLGAASADNFDVPDVPRPLQIQMVRVKQFFDAKAATIVDAREATDYAEGHIPGAINLPYDQVVTDPARLDAFDPKGKPIIVYCGGGTCELSMNLGFALVSAGKKKVL